MAESLREAQNENDVLRLKISIDAKNNEERINEKDEKIEKLEDENESLRGNIGENTDKINILEDELYSKRQLINEKNNEIQQLKAQKEELFQEIARLKTSMKHNKKMNKQTQKMQEDRIRKLEIELKNVTEKLEDKGREEESMKSKLDDVLEELKKNKEERATKDKELEQKLDKYDDLLRQILHNQSQAGNNLAFQKVNNVQVANTGVLHYKDILLPEVGKNCKRSPRQRQFKNT